MKKWLCLLLVGALLTGWNGMEEGRWEKVWWGVMDETALEMAGAEKEEREEGEEEVRFYFPWLEMLLEEINL